MPVTIMTIQHSTVTSKIAILRLCCDGVTVVTVLTSANLTRERGLDKESRAAREKIREMTVTTVIPSQQGR